MNLFGIARPNRVLEAFAEIDLLDGSEEIFNYPFGAVFTSDSG